MFFSNKEAAKRLRVHHATFENWLEDGKIPKPAEGEKYTRNDLAIIRQLMKSPGFKHRKDGVSLISIPELAKVAKIDQYAIRRAIRRGAIPAPDIGDLHRFYRADRLEDLKLAVLTIEPQPQKQPANLAAEEGYLSKKRAAARAGTTAVTIDDRIRRGEIPPPTHLVRGRYYYRIEEVDSFPANPRAAHGRWAKDRREKK